MHVAGLFEPHALPDADGARVPAGEVAVLPCLLAERLVGAVEIDDLDDQFVFLGRVRRHIEAEGRVSALVRADVSAVEPHVAGIVDGLEVEQVSFARAHVEVEGAAVPHDGVILRFVHAGLGEGVAVGHLDGAVEFGEGHRGRGLEGLGCGLHRVVALVAVLGPGRCAGDREVPGAVEIDPVASDALGVGVLDSLHCFPFSVSFHKNNVVVFVIESTVIALLCRSHFLVDASIL